LAVTNGIVEHIIQAAVGLDTVQPAIDATQVICITSQYPEVHPHTNPLREVPVEPEIVLQETQVFSLSFQMLLDGHPHTYLSIRATELPQLKQAASAVSMLVELQQH